MVQFDEFKKIYNTCDSSFYKLAFLTFYLFGLRLGELLGLQVDSFDFIDCYFEIYQEASFKTGTGGYVIVSPKSESSKRFYKMPDHFTNLIKILYKSCFLHHIEDGELNVCVCLKVKNRVAYSIVDRHKRHRRKAS